MPIYGVVKRHLQALLPTPLAADLLHLPPGHRTPAFLLHTKNAELVSWYLRLGSSDNRVPGNGIIRVAGARAFLETTFPIASDRFAEISAVCAWLLKLRCRARSYPRADVSLEPIVRLEDQLHAVMPRIGQQLARFHLALQH
jgi:hypothetical protein